MNYRELRNLFREHEHSNPDTHLTAYITFAPESFGPEVDYSVVERTYMISSNNKAFQPNMGGYSIFGSCLDGKTDPCLRLDYQMAEENGGKNGWLVEDCCIVAYLLICTNERDIQQPKLFYAQEAAAETMLRELCKEGNLIYEDAQDVYDRDSGEFQDDGFGFSKNSAWLNAETGNWDWQIREMQIYNLHGIHVGAMEEKKPDPSYTATKTAYEKLCEQAAKNTWKIGWRLDYQTLLAPEKRMLRISASHVSCDGQLNISFDITDVLIGDYLVGYLYDRFVEFYGGRYTATPAFQDTFLQIFHEDDREKVAMWLEAPCGETVFCHGCRQINIPQSDCELWRLKAKDDRSV